MTQIPDGLELTAFDEQFNADPYSVYRRLRETDPIHQDINSFYEHSWTISDYDLVRMLLTDSRLSVDPGKVGLRRDPRADNPVTLRAPDLMNLDEPDHSRLRSLLQKAFTPSSVAQFLPRIEIAANECLDSLDPGDEFDVVSGFAKPFPTMVIAEYLGVDRHRHPDFKRWTDTLLLQGYPMPTETQWTEIVDADLALRQYIGEVIAKRRREPADDLVTRLIKARENKDLLDDNEIVDLCYLLIGAGNFTTTDLISNCIHTILASSIHINDWIGSTERLDALIEECLRFEPPALNVRRFVTEDIALRDTIIRQGAVVNLLIAAAGHDPSMFETPDVFDPECPRAPHLAFGRGIHHCLGAPLARAETRIAVKAFFTRFPQSGIVSHKRSKRMDFRGFANLRVRPQPGSNIA